MSKHYDFRIPNLGSSKIQSPIILSKTLGDSIANYVFDKQYILYDIESKPSKQTQNVKREHLLAIAGPREKIYFEPSKVHAGIISCGGLCPGINDVIRSIVMTLWYRYNVKRISGIINGYKGFLPEYNFPTLELDPKIVSEIHRKGGTILGSARGGGDKTSEIVDSIERMNLNILFTIGGDGTQRGALKIAEEAEKRNLKLSVIGVPKTIDNDLSYMQKSFGFETAVANAVAAISAAHTEAHDTINGIGIVKVMGRHSGFIAAHAALAINDVNFVLIPEVPFDLEGENGLFSLLKNRLIDRKHAVILVAEGAGQRYMENEKTLKDESGNIKLNDIGLFLKEKIKDYFKKENIEINLKYIDPSYMIRSAPADPNDSIFCARLGSNSVHAAMAGKTKMLISLVNNYFVHLPIKMAISKRNCIDPESPLWRDVLEATGQPAVIG